MKILLSIKPEFAELILSGKKAYEFRRVRFRNKAVRSALIYATQPIGKIVGQFDIRKVISGTPRTVWRKTRAQAGVTHSLFTDYFQGRAIAHALVVSNTKRFRRPLDLSTVVPSGVAPQSFSYVAAWPARL